MSIERPVRTVCCDLSSLLHDETKMERIIHIVEALWDGTASIEALNFDGEACCRLPDLRVVFYENPISVEEANRLPVFQLANLILEAVQELEDCDYEYCCDVLNIA